MRTVSSTHAIAAILAVAALIAASHMDSTAVTDNFETVLYNPAHHEGTRVLWGGMVMDADLTPKGSRLVLAEIPLDFLGATGSNKYSRGRFVALSSDSSVARRFKVNDLAIIEGIVQGAETLPVGQKSVTHPIITIERIDACRRTDGYGYVKGPMGWKRVDGPFCAENGEGGE